MQGESSLQSSRDGVGLLSILWIFTRPGELFRRVEDTPGYGWPLVALLVLVMLAGYVQVQTGLVDRLAELRTQEDMAALERAAAGNIDRVRFREQMDSAQKAGEFLKLITKLWVIVGAPLKLLVSYLVIASILYAAVALTGRKPEYHTLMSICVYSGFIDLVACWLVVGMMIYYRTMEVGTSLVMLAPKEKISGWLALGAIDPFRMWYWVLVGIGLIVTHQLGRRGAIVTCAILWFVASGVSVASQFSRYS